MWNRWARCAGSRADLDGGTTDLEGGVLPAVTGQVARLARLLIAQAALDRVQNRRLTDRGDEMPPSDTLTQKGPGPRIGPQDTLAPPDQHRGQRHRLQQRGDRVVAHSGLSPSR